MYLPGSKKSLIHSVKVFIHMAMLPSLRQIVRDSKLSFEEIRAFEAGLEMLTEREQAEFYTHLEKDPELIYPIYIHYKAKARAIRGTEEEWQEAIEAEIRDLEEYMTKKRVGDEVA